MKVKTIKAVEAYRALKTLKVGGMSDDAMLAVWKKRRAKEEVRDMTAAEKQEISEINTWFAAWNKKGEEYLKSLAEKEVEVKIDPLDAAELLKAFKGSDRTFEDAEKLDWLTM